MIVFAYAAAVLCGLLWLAAVVGVGYISKEMFDDGDWGIGAVAALFSALIFVFPLAAYSMSGDDAYANRLCLRGHQEWRTQSTPIIVGNVIVPTESTHKVWMCESWEAQ